MNIKNVFSKESLQVVGSIISVIALTVVSLNINSTCMLIAHQSELPEDAKKLRKF